jgi:hypothetical protein
MYTSTLENIQTFYTKENKRPKNDFTIIQKADCKSKERYCCMMIPTLNWDLNLCDTSDPQGEQGGHT